jgi:hypothetical protein
MPRKKKQKTENATRSRQSSPVEGQPEGAEASGVGTEAAARALELEVRENITAASGGGVEGDGNKRERGSNEADEGAKRRKQAFDRRSKFGTPKQYVSFSSTTRSNRSTRTAITRSMGKETCVSHIAGKGPL